MDQPEETVTLTLPISQLNVILLGLGELSAKQAYKTIQLIETQTSQQLKKDAPPPAG